MILILDTTALVSDPYLTGLPWKVLTRARAQWDLRLLITEVTFLEAVAAGGRRINHAYTELARWTKTHGAVDARRLAGPILDALADSGAAYEDELRSRLASLGVATVPVPDIPHLQLVARAVERRKPCDADGDGYRDSLNWFALLEQVTSTKDDVILVSDNSKDFAHSGDRRNEFHPDLVAELEEAGGAGRVRLVPNLADAVTLVASTVSLDHVDLSGLLDQLSREALRTYLLAELRAHTAAGSVDPRECALPTAVTFAAIERIETIGEVVLTRRSESGSTSVEAFTTELSVQIVMRGPMAAFDDESIRVIGDSVDGALAVLTKTLIASGLVELNQDATPVRCDSLELSATTDDPGLAAWQRRDDSRAAVAGPGGLNLSALFTPAALDAISTSAIPPGVLAALANYSPPIYPGLLDAASKYPLPPGALTALNYYTPTIDQATLAASAGSGLTIPWGLFDAVSRPAAKDGAGGNPTKDDAREGEEHPDEDAPDE